MQEELIQRRTYVWTVLVPEGSELMNKYGLGPFQEAIVTGHTKLRPGHVAIKIGERTVTRKGVKITVDTFAVLSRMYLVEQV